MNAQFIGNFKLLTDSNDLSSYSTSTHTHIQLKWKNSIFSALHLNFTRKIYSEVRNGKNSNSLCIFFSFNFKLQLKIEYDGKMINLKFKFEAVFYGAIFK